MDLACEFSLDLPYQKRLEAREKLAEYFEKKFNRFVDIHTVGEYLTNATVNQITPHKKIF